LVGLFNRLAEEWNRSNPDAGYDEKLKGLATILMTNLFGIDKNRSACLIAAFSLYLAFLDQLSPPDIRRVLKKVKVLPPLLAEPTSTGTTIRCADFFTDAATLPEQVDYLDGNPPWAKAKGPSAPASLWCAKNNFPFPGKQIAAAFMWKARDYLKPQGIVCFVLPHGLLFNYNPLAINFQTQWFCTHAVELILNLADFQCFLFEVAKAPAFVIRYSREKPPDSSHRIDYWTPKTDWAVARAEMISILPQDRVCLTVKEILDDLRSDDAPLIWKERFWATSRDSRLLDRLRLNSRMRNVLGQRGKSGDKRWIIAEGFEPFGANDLASTRRDVSLSRTARVEARTHDLDLFVLPEDCEIQPTLELDLRRAISDTSIFRRPLVLVTEGFSNVAFANFDIAYRHGIRGIHGPASDADLLAFVTVYLRSALARYFLFHTSASWGVTRARVDIDDLMRLPFPFPDQTENPARSSAIIAEVANILNEAMKNATDMTIGRTEIVQRAQAQAEVLVNEYFDINDIERILIFDTNTTIIPSTRPSRARPGVPTILPGRPADYADYVKVLCDTLNGWASKEFQVHGRPVADGRIGVGMVVLEKTRLSQSPRYLDGATKNVLETLHQLQRGAAKGRGTVELARGLKVFDKTLQYVTKPIGRRFWTRTAALNDADEIAGTILMRPLKEDT
jgi:hypothetical protein